MGSSTVCLATINLAVGRLQVATLGDSGVFGAVPGGGAGGGLVGCGRQARAAGGVPQTR
jgi:hypothetical protein